MTQSATPNRPRWLFAAALAFTTAFVPYAAIQAQPAAKPDTAQAETSASSRAAEDENAKNSDTNVSTIAWMFGSLGWMYSTLFLGVATGLITSLLLNLRALNRERILPDELIRSFETHLNSKQYQHAYDAARDSSSFLGRVLAAGFARMSRGYARATSAMEEAAEDEFMRLSHLLSYLALIATVSPMIGLLGTVHGMIDSFMVIALANSPPKASELAEGISTSLFTTLLGLAIAIPALALHNVLRNRAARLAQQVASVSDQLMGRFENAPAG